MHNFEPRWIALRHTSGRPAQMGLYAHGGTYRLLFDGGLPDDGVRHELDSADIEALEDMFERLLSSYLAVGYEEVPPGGLPAPRPTRLN